MSRTINFLRIAFFLVCVLGSLLTCYVVPEWGTTQARALYVGALLGAFVILVDVFLKGFSIRGLSAATFGLFLGWLCSFFIANSPLFEYGDEGTLFLARLALFIILSYLGAVIALRGKDEFNLVIPYMRFVPHEVDTPVAVVDTSALIDGRIASICRAKFLNYALVVPRWVLQELQHVADSSDPARKARGRKGLDVLNELRRMPHVDLRIHDTPKEDGQDNDASIVDIARRLKAKVLTTDFNLAKIAEFHSVEWLNLNSLAKALSPDLISGEEMEVDLVKPGKEQGQALGFMPDGSMVVVNDARRFIGKRVQVTVQSVLPSGGGRMVFAQLKQE
ncbi:MAG: PIN domain-containing protein [Opitutales bacterium]|nr:PIN domain-containing protein [Opitutales bacterium]